MASISTLLLLPDFRYISDHQRAHRGTIVSPCGLLAIRFKYERQLEQHCHHDRPKYCRRHAGFGRHHFGIEGAGLGEADSRICDLGDVAAFSRGRDFGRAPLGAMSRHLMRRLSLPSQIFLALLALTLIVWVLRGLTVLSFLPGLVIWLLLLLTIGAGVITSLQRMR